MQELGRRQGKQLSQDHIGAGQDESSGLPLPCPQASGPQRLHAFCCPTTAMKGFFTRDNVQDSLLSLSFAWPRDQATEDSALYQKSRFPPLSHVGGAIRRPASEKKGPGLGQSQMFAAISKPLPCSWGGRKGMFTNCPNIWTRKKASMHHADGFEAQCWVPAEIRHLGEGRVLSSGSMVSP